MLLFVAMLLLTARGAARAASCALVHGRLALYNGAPTARIDVAGTRRVLGVIQPNQAFADLPASARALWAGLSNEQIWASEVVGDFQVCAVTARQVGHMQMVSVTATRGLVLRPRP
jgi:hypothetical protein